MKRGKGVLRMGGMQMSIDISQEELEQFLMEKGFLVPLDAGFDAPYAEAVEYGTPPGTITPYDAIDNWARLKLNMTNEKERREFVHAVVNSHYRRGRKPNPFFMPAVAEVTADIRKYMTKREGVYGVANAVISLSQRNIQEKGITHTGGLIESGYVRRADSADAEDAQERFYD